MLNSEGLNLTVSGDHYTTRYKPERPFFSTTESQSLPILNLPTVEGLKRLEIKSARILSITGSGQILDYAALLERSGAIKSLGLVDYNPSQNIFVAYLLTQAVIAQETGEAVRDRIIATRPPEIREIFSGRMFELFPDLEDYFTFLPADLFSLLAHKFVCADAADMKPEECDDCFTFNTDNFRYYFLLLDELAESLVSMVKTGKVRFHLGSMEDFRPVKAGEFHLIYTSDVHPHITRVELERFIDTIELLLHPRGMCMVSGFGTDCMSIATGEARREEELFKVLKEKASLYPIVDDHKWRRVNEKSLVEELGFEGESAEDWYNFLRSGPYGLKPKQHMPILLLKPEGMIRLFG